MIASECRCIDGYVDPQRFAKALFEKAWIKEQDYKDLRNKLKKNES
jgi:hypothetical protein